MEENNRLHLAVATGNYDDVVSLVLAGLNINEVDINNCSPLDVAVELGHTNIVEFLIKHGAAVDHNSHDHWVEYPIHLAAKNGHLEIVKLLMDHDIEDYCAKSDFSLIHLAAEGGHLNVVKYFLDIGMNVDIPDGRNCTPLTSAAAYGKVETVDFLFSRGANIYHKDCDENIPLHRAASSGHVEVVKYLIEKDTLLNNENDIKKRMINQKNIHKSNSLHGACLLGQIEVVEFLVEKGALINEIDDHGRTCLHIAVERGYLNLIELLIKSGATYTLMDGMEPVNLLRVAARFGKVDVLEYFLERGGTIHFKNFGDQTILHIATQGGHVKVVEFLINKGADVNTKSLSKGDTALHYSSKYCHPEITDLLIQKGSHIEEKNYDGLTPLDVAFKASIYRLWFDKKRDVIKVIIKYILLKNKALKSNFLDDYVPDIFSYIRELNDFCDECRREIAGMEKVFLNNTNVSIGTVLRAIFDENILVKYLYNESIINDLEHIENYCIHFPVYANITEMVKDRIEKGKKRKQLVERAGLKLDYLTPKLPLESKWKIFSYLSTDDLYNFVKSF